MLNQDERHQMIDLIRRLPAELEMLVEGLTEEQLHTHFMTGEWTVAQNVHHLADAHMNAFIRTKLLLTEDRPMVKPWQPDPWAETVDSQRLPIEDSLAILRGLHDRWAALFASLSEADWARIGVHPVDGDFMLEKLLRTYSRHGLAHIDQIERTLAAAP